MLLFAVSLMSQQPDPKLGAAVEFSTGQFIAVTGWARNTRSYEKVKRLIEELKEVRLTFKRTSSDCDLVVVSDAPLLAGVTQSQRRGRTEVWQLVLTSQLLSLFGLERNTLLEMRAYSALHQMPSAVALYGLIASQKPGVVRKFDVREICEFCGLTASRDEDNRKSLRLALEKLMETGRPGNAAPAIGTAKAFEPILAAWSLQKSNRGWVLAVTRTQAFVRQPAAD
ncbi:hypothetical protein WDZ92_33205 [Nostoc sp. NIES-2111]